jgi:hypothetical protein
MSTVKSSSENLTLNADGAGSDVVIQNNGTETVRIDSSGDLNLSSGELNLTGNVNASATSTENRVFNIGKGRTGNGSSFINFVGDTTYTDYGLRILRGGGAGGNSSSSIIHRGTGQLRIFATDAGSIKFRTSNTERASISSTGDFSFNSGYGSSATAYGCRAWVNFNGIGTIAIRGSGNVSSVTDLGVGNYRPNFATAMPDTNYAAVGTAGNTSSGILGIVNAANRNISFCQVYPISGGVDAGLVEIAIFR